MTGRFIRLLPEYRDQFAEDDLKTLAGKMTADPESPIPEGQPDPEEDPDITAAYTYLGQFTDHDLTFDPTSQLREALTDQQLEALADFRTPRFDLDNLYGRGPADQPYLYDKDGLHMQLGKPMPGNPFDPGAHDLPRGPNGRALIGDPRNDENRIVAQLHAIFLRFHNKVAKHLGDKATFEKVRDLVRWHYQWMLVTDFLPKVISEDTYQCAFGDTYYPTPTLPGLRDSLRLMPVEFSVAAFRFGHSMIRPDYRLNEETPRRPLFLPRDSDGTRVDGTADLRGFRAIPSDWAIDWRFFIDLDPGDHDPAKPEPQKAYRIDTSLVSPLGNLPPQIVSGLPKSLALRNLERGRIFSLPTGQQVARALKEEPIPNEKLVIGKATVEDRDKLPTLKDKVPGLAGRAPLWAYILSEAQVKSWDRLNSGASPDSISIKLGPVGGRIVAGVFAALLRGDPTSYLYSDDPFKPIPKFAPNGRFGLAELINAALDRTPSHPA
jgi:Animal haem peroxidase